MTTLEETARAMKMLVAAYPSWKVPEATVVVWAKQLEDFQEPDVDAAVMLWMREEPRPPAMADIIRLARAEAKQRHEGAAERFGIGTGEHPASKEQVRKMLAITRGLLREWESNKGKHWHGGPDPCRLCGGINPNLRVKREEDAA